MIYNTSIWDCIFGSGTLKWHKFNKYITNEVKRDLKEIKRNNEFNKEEDDCSTKLKVIIKGEHTKHFRVYFKYNDNCCVVFNTIANGIHIQPLFSFDEKPSAMYIDDYKHYTNGMSKFSLMFKTRFDNMVLEWISKNINEAECRIELSHENA